MSVLTGNAATLDNHGFALLARLHVILRRQKGRITDIEYMRANPAYFRHVLGLMDESDPAEVRQVCGKLEDLYFSPRGLFALLNPPTPVATIAPVLPPEIAPVLLAQSASMASVSQKYVGRLR